MVSISRLTQTLHDVQTRMAAQAMLLLAPNGSVLEHTGEIEGLDEGAVGVLLAQSMMAFHYLVANDASQQIFFAYQDAYYHYAGTGKRKTPFLVAVFQSRLHHPPALGTTKFCVKRAYDRIGLSSQEASGRASRQTGGDQGKGFWESFAHVAAAPLGDPDLRKALEETARELQARLLLAVDEGGTVVGVVGETEHYDVPSIGALASGSLGAFAEISALTGGGLADDQHALIILEGPKGIVLLARDAGPLAFLAILPPKGFLGMARLMLKDLLRQEWQVVRAAWEDMDMPLENLEETPFSGLWAEH